MVDKALEIFRVTADCGSFSKAAVKLYITHTAVIKQINNLEEHIGVRLFERSTHGVRLTTAGEVFYRESVELTRLSQEAVKRVRAAGQPEQAVLRVGTSALSPCRDFLEFWQGHEGGTVRFHFQIIPFSDDRRRYEHLGRDNDLLVGPHDYPAIDGRYRFTPVGRYMFALLMDRGHPLAKRRSLKFRDLAGETVMIMKPGTSPINDSMRAALTAELPQAAIEDIQPIYNMDTFNLCAESGALLLAPECWRHTHPALAAVPLEEDFSIEYGVIACREPGGDMERFLEDLEDKLLSCNSPGPQNLTP